MVPQAPPSAEDSNGTSTGSDREPPGPTGLPLIGNTLALAQDVFGFYEQMAHEYDGDVTRYGAMGDTAYLLTHPDLVEQVLVTDAPQFVKGEMQQRQIGSAFGEGMLLAEDDDWRAQRTTAQPAFYRERIEAYAPVVVSHAESMRADWNDGETIEIHETMTELTLSVLARALFGIDVRGRQSPVRSAATAARERFDTSRIGAYLPAWLPTRVNRQYAQSMASLRAYIEELIAERRATEELGTDLLSLLVGATESGEMDDDTLRDNMATFLFAGHETTALALTYTLFTLGHHPAVQERLHAELDEVLGDDTPTAADLPRLAFTERVITEALRLYPPVWTVFREPITDIEIGGHTVPAGSVVSLPQWIVHRDERWYDDPLEFRPDRWEGADDDRPEYAYYPFGGGPRHCIGMRFARMEARLVVATVVQEFAVDTLTDPPLELTASANTLPAEPVELRLSRR